MLRIAVDTAARPFVGSLKISFKKRLHFAIDARNVRALVAVRDNNAATFFQMKTFLHIAKPMTSREHRDAAAYALRNGCARLQGFVLID